MTRLEFYQINQESRNSIEYSNLYPIMKSMYIFYKDLFNCEPVLMVTDVMNAAQYIKIVPSNEFNEAVCEYIGCEVYEIQNNDEYLAQFETINFNSKLLKDILN